MHDNSSRRETSDGVGTVMQNNPDRPDYEGLERKAWQDSFHKIHDQYANKNSNLIKKIRTFSERFGFDEKVVCEKIGCDALFRAHLAADPKKQNLHEKIAAEWIGDIQEVFDFQKLLRTGRNAVFLGSNGEFIDGQNAKGNDKERKSLDFKWRTDNWMVYASHKYTKQTGGNQGNQYKEIEGLLSRFLKSKAKDTVLISIADGDCYSKERMKSLNHNRRRDMPLSFAIHIEELPGILAEILERQGLPRSEEPRT